MSDEKVVPFTGDTILDIPPEKILSGAIRTDLDVVLVIGRNKDGALYVAGSMASIPENVWLIECAKQFFMESYG